MFMTILRYSTKWYITAHFLVQFDGQSLSKGEITKQNFCSCVEYERPKKLDSGFISEQVKKDLI